MCKQAELSGHGWDASNWKESDSGNGGPRCRHAAGKVSHDCKNFMAMFPVFCDGKECKKEE